MIKPRPLFVVGSPRSGTSLVRDMLRLLGGVYMLPEELQILRFFVGARHDLPADGSCRRKLSEGTIAVNLRQRSLWPSAEVMRRIESGSNCRADFIASFIVEIARLEGAAPSGLQYWGEKTPQNVHIWPEIVDAWPESRFIVVVRDPRDVVGSMHRSWGRSVTRSAEIWRRSAEASIRLLEARPDHTVVCTYARMTEQPDRTLDRIASWLEVETSAIDGLISQERWGGAAGKKGVVTPASGWRSTLEPAVTQSIEKIAYDEMRYFGFDPERAQGSEAVPALLLKALRMSDAVASLEAYTSERGLGNAIAYKLRQWRSTHLNNPGGD